MNIKESPEFTLGPDELAEIATDEDLLPPDKSDGEPAILFPGANAFNIEGEIDIRVGDVFYSYHDTGRLMRVILSKKEIITFAKRKHTFLYFHEADQFGDLSEEHHRHIKLEKLESYKDLEICEVGSPGIFKTLKKAMWAAEKIFKERIYSSYLHLKDYDKN